MKSYREGRRSRPAAWLVVAFVALASVPAQAGEKAAASPVGRWRTFDDSTGQAKSIVAIWEREGKLFGKIEKLINPPADAGPNPRCDKCEGSRKDQPITGMTILWNMARDDDEWSGGRILDPENGEVYRCTIWLDGSDRLKVRGYVGIFYRTQTWHREKP